MYILISYDISDDKRRSKVAKLLEDYGIRVQYSAFECLLDEGALLSLRRQLQEVIDYQGDSIRFYRLCKRCRSAIDILGLGIIHSKEDFYII